MENLLKKLTETKVNFDDFLSDFNLTSEQKATLWKSLLFTMRYKEIFQSRNTFLFSSQIKENSLFDKISDDIDFEEADDEDISKLYQALEGEETNTADGFWNESVQDLINLIKKTIEELKGDLSKKVLFSNTNGETTMTVENLFNGNAAKSFTYPFYVEPEKNVAGNTFVDVRTKQDLISYALNNSDNLQFTCEDSKSGDNSE